VAREKPKRKFIRERRRNACPACLDRDALTITGHKVYEGRLFRLESREKFGPCQICGGKGYIHEEYPVGNEWRRYPWVIAK
jgi:hypothetical protein